MPRVTLVLIGILCVLFSDLSYSQTIDINVLTYNLLNYPNGNTSALDGDAVRAVYFREIVENADADIIIVQEFRTTTGSNAEGISNANVLLNELNNNGVLGKTYAHANTYLGYGSTNFGYLGNMIFFNSDLFNFNSQAEVPSVNTATTNSGNTVWTPRPATHYQLTYPKNPDCPEQEVTLNVFSAHLKAGFDPASNTEISDEARRTLGAEDIIDYIANNGLLIENTIIGGDFNFQGSFEAGYQVLRDGIIPNNIDPLSGWTRNVASQVNKYTQSTRAGSTSYNNFGSSGGLDDRFDLWFYNKTIQNGNEKITYNNNSYQTWGSNGVGWNGGASSGSHPLGQEIEYMSDHYPVYMQLNIDAPTTLCTPVCPVTIHYSTPVADGVYSASFSITSDSVIGSGQNVTFFGGDHVELQPGFEVILGAEFLGDINPCTPLDGSGNGF